MKCRRLGWMGAAGLAWAAAAPCAAASDYSWRGDWPTHHTFADGTDVGASVLYQYDVNDFSNDQGQLPDARTNRRKYFGFYLKKKGAYDAVAQYDFQSHTWLDANVRVQTKAVTGQDFGAVRIGQGKTPVGFEGNTSTGADSFLETALPTQAVYANRRVGVDWALFRPEWLVAAGWYPRGNIDGRNPGHTLAGRVAWVPRHAPGDVLHLGLAASHESPSGRITTRGSWSVPSVRFRSNPEAGLAAIPLVDSGKLANVADVDRYGFEGLWIRGPWSLQGEYLRADTAFNDGRPGYRAQGWYAFASWVATGESRPYAGGNVGNVVPARARGALELLLRYSELDLDHGGVRGGREHDWTAGLNWYLGPHLKLQANYVMAFSNRRDVIVDPRVTELRAQISF